MRAIPWIIALNLLACDKDGLHSAPLPSPTPAVSAPLRYASGACHGAELSALERPSSKAARAIHVFSNYRAEGPVTVVLDLGRPITLVLASRTSAEWHLELLPGTVVEEILLISEEPSTADLPGVPQQHRSSSRACAYTLGSANCDVVALLDLIQEVYGAEPTSIHGCYGGTGFGLYDAQAPVRWDGVPAGLDLTFSADRLQVSASGQREPRSLFATHPRDQGRYYFEVEVLAGTSEEGTIGVSNPFVSDTCSWSRDGALRCDAGARLEAYGPGDTLGVAVNLDELELYYSKNGRWLSADPAVGGGTPLPAWSERAGLFPSATLAVGDSLRGRFAAEELRYPPPAGFTEWRRVGSAKN